MTKGKKQYKPEVVYHPGETLREKLDELAMGMKEFALRTGKPEKTVSFILNGESSITPEMAVQFEHVLKVPAQFWLKLQSNYDEYMVRKDRRDLLTDAVEWAKRFPIAEMTKKGWITPQPSMEEKTGALLDFFGFSQHKAWEDYYVGQKLRATFRISLAHSKEPEALSAWMRKGDLQAIEMSSGPYLEKSFKEALNEVRKLVAQHPVDYFEQLQKLCIEAGVKVVYTPCLPKAPINGSARWVNDHPVIQLSGRQKVNDIFWFTFFHEAGHILKHGKKDVFLENIEYSDLDRQKEKEADDFASEFLLPDSHVQEIVQQMPLMELQYERFASKFGTHPGIIIGRLQHIGKLSYSACNHLKKAIDLD